MKQFIVKLKEIYSVLYDIETDKMLGTTPLTFQAQYRREDERYMVSRKAKVWRVENREIVFVHTPQSLLSEHTLQQFQQNMQNHFQKFIPKTDHMSSIFIGMLLTNQPVSAHIQKAIKRFRKIKFIRFGMNGWAEFYVAVVHVANGQLLIHPKGRQFIEEIEKKLKRECVLR